MKPLDTIQYCRTLKELFNLRLEKPIANGFVHHGAIVGDCCFMYTTSKILLIIFKLDVYIEEDITKPSCLAEGFLSLHFLHHVISSKRNMHTKVRYKHKTLSMKAFASNISS